MIEKKSTKEKIKEMFQQGAILTSCGCAEQYVTADLRKYVSMLRREGLNIVDERVSSFTGKSHNKYWLKKEEAPKPVEPIAKIIPITTKIEEPIQPGQQELKFGT